MSISPQVSSERPDTVFPAVSPVHPQGNGHLGNNSKFSLPPPTPGVNVGRYTLLTVAKQLLPDDAVAWCSVRSTGNGEGVKVNYHDHKRHASYANLTTCSSVWTCPVCAPRIMSERRDELERVVDAHRAKGGGVLLVTLTLRHHVGDDLGDLIQALNAAWSATKSGLPWQRFKARVGQVGDVNALEVTWGASNGWHPHKHVLMLVDHEPTKEDILEIHSWLSERFITMAEKRGRYVSGSWGVDVRGHSEAAKYISKWGESAELTSTDTKAGDGVTPFGLLALYHQGDKRAGWLFQEYAAAIKGKKRLFWSQSLKQAREDAQAEIEAENVAQEKPRTVVYLHDGQYEHVIKHKKRDDLLQAVERCGGKHAQVWRWLETECGVVYDPDLEHRLAKTEALNGGLDVSAVKRECDQARFVHQMQEVERRLLLREAEMRIDEGSYLSS